MKAGPEGLKYEQSPLRIDYSVKNLVRMNLNENLVLPRAFLNGIATRCLDRLESRYYPSDLGEGEMYELLVEISKYCNCSTDMICLGDGSDQLIDLLFRMKLKKPGKDALAIVEPTFSLYSLMARRGGANVVSIPLKPFSAPSSFALDAESLIKTCKSKNSIRLLALASPNNPTGVQYPIEQVREIMEELPGITVLLDEAYVEYGKYDATRLLRTYKNLVVMRTFSKAFALASHRLGFLLSSDLDFVREFNSEYQYPYPVATFGVLMATMLLKNKSQVLDHSNRTKDLRRELIDALSSQRFSSFVHPTKDSQANFVLTQSPNAKKISLELLEKYRIALKYIERIGRERDFLRITVGTRELNERLLYALRRISSA